MARTERHRRPTVTRLVTAPVFAALLMMTACSIEVPTELPKPDTTADSVPSTTIAVPSVTSAPATLGTTPTSPTDAFPSPTPSIPATANDNESWALSTGNWSFANLSGFTFDISMSVFGKTRIGTSSLTHPSGKSIDYSGACSLDPERDIAIPFTWRATATTKKFTTPVTLAAIIRNTSAHPTYEGQGVPPHQDDERIEVVQEFSTGVKCSTFSSTNQWGYNQTGGFSIKFTDPLDEGESASSIFFVVVKNYFSPATPDGDKALLDWIHIHPLAAGNKSDAATVYKDIAATKAGLFDIYSDNALSLSGQAK